MILPTPAGSTVEPSVMAEWLGGFFAALLLFAILVRIIETFQPKQQQRTVTGIAITSGVLIALGITPFGAIATELAQLFKTVPTEYPGLVKTLLTFETAFMLLYGLGKMHETGGYLAVISFVVGFFGGLFLPYYWSGAFLIIASMLVMETSDGNRW